MNNNKYNINWLVQYQETTQASLREKKKEEERRKEVEKKEKERKNVVEKKEQHCFIEIIQFQYDLPLAWIGNIHKSIQTMVVHQDRILNTIEQVMKILLHYSQDMLVVIHVVLPLLPMYGKRSTITNV
jgi:hypothetical protein